MIVRKPEKRIRFNFYGNSATLDLPPTLSLYGTLTSLYCTLSSLPGYVPHLDPSLFCTLTSLPILYLDFPLDIPYSDHTYIWTQVLAFAGCWCSSCCCCYHDSITTVTCCCIYVASSFDQEGPHLKFALQLLDQVKNIRLSREVSGRVAGYCLLLLLFYLTTISKWQLPTEVSANFCFKNTSSVS